MSTVRERFEAKVDRRGENECWPWLGYRRPVKKGRKGQGHGQFKMPHRLISAHAAALVLSGSDWPGQGSIALHSCDNPVCVNPKHLRWGTCHDNIRDMMSRERTHCAKGELNAQAILTEGMVRRIFDLRSTRSAYGSKAALARVFKVSPHTIHDIWNGKSWTHITGLTPTRRKHIKVFSTTG